MVLSGLSAGGRPDARPFGLILNMFHALMFHDSRVSAWLVSVSQSVKELFVPLYGTKIIKICVTHNRGYSDTLQARNSLIYNKLRVKQSA